MAKRTAAPEEIPPSLNKAEGRKCLLTMKEKGEKLLGQHPIPEPAFDTWSNSTLEYITKTFGSWSNHISTFIGDVQVEFVGYGGGPSESQREQRRAQKLNDRISVLGSLIEQLETDMALETPQVLPPTSTDDAIWPLLHAKVITAAKARFDGGHYADAVESAFKELNTVVKEMVKKKSGQEFDGANLMQKAFSPNPPVLVALDDLSTETGRNIQQGYMQIFTGAMVGIRNPKAHANLSITKERAVHFLFLASLLFHKLDERP